LIVAPIGGIGEVRAGDDVGRLLASAIGQGVRNGDIVVVASKVVAKAEGRTRPIEEREAAIDGETVRLVARRRTPDGNLRIVENRLGLVMAAAGVDTSNVPPGSVVLLPVDPDASAAAIRRAIGAAWGVSVGVIVADTFGRPWREGSTDQAIGAAGVRVAVDLRGTPDADGRVLRGTVIAVADELAAASELVRGKAAGIAAALIRGAERWVVPTDGPGARALVRPGEQDLFPCGRIDP
jgi:coenzyme F420-0:L-glutamate ligase/coenzyme F420-1:gamma-L-glutamate ligase